MLPSAPPESNLAPSQAGAAKAKGLASSHPAAELFEGEGVYSLAMCPYARRREGIVMVGNIAIEAVLRRRAEASEKLCGCGPGVGRRAQITRRASVEPGLHSLDILQLKDRVTLSVCLVNFLYPALTRESFEAGIRAAVPALPGSPTVLQVRVPVGDLIKDREITIAPSRKI